MKKKRSRVVSKLFLLVGIAAGGIMLILLQSINLSVVPGSVIPAVSAPEIAAVSPVENIKVHGSRQGASQELPAVSEKAGDDCKIVRPEYSGRPRIRTMEIVRSYSMFPCIDSARVKAVLVAWDYPFDDLIAGDVIAWFKDLPADAHLPDGTIVKMNGFVHRIVAEYKFVNGDKVFVTKGDNNPFSDDSIFYKTPEVVTRQKYKGLVVGVVNEP